MLHSVAQIEVEEKTNQLVLFPNPATTSFSISNSSNTPLNIEVYNAQGSLVHSFYQSSNNPIDIQHLPAGVYWVKTEGINQLKKLIVQ